MALIVEDGSIVTNANSYSSLADIKAYATARARTLPDDDVLVEGYAIRSMDYLESYREEYKGTRTSELQMLEWPRTDVVLYGEDFPSNDIPLTLIQAQQQLVIDVANGVELQPTLVMTERVKSKKISSLETEWFDAYSTGVAPQIDHIDNLLSPLLNPSSFGLKTLRV